jgi:uncharacterized protein
VADKDNCGVTILEFSFLLLFIAYAAGLLGALTGLGGGVIIIPTLVLLFHVNVHYAMGAALISVIATSSGSAAAFLREGFINLRIGMFLEIGAVAGAIIGAITTAYLPVAAIEIIFGAVLIFSAYMTWRRKEELERYTSSHPWAVKLKLNGVSPSPNGPMPYYVQRVPLALTLMTIGGVLSGLLGIGSGSVKVLAMDQVMRLPYKVSTTTSNFIIGITAATSAGVYFAHGYIDPALSFPVVLGVLLGAITGTRVLVGAKSETLRSIFSIVIVIMALQMIYKGLAGA